MLSLAEQVHGHNFRACGVISDDEDLGWPRVQVYTSSTEQLSLGLSDVGVPWASNEVNGIDALSAQGHSRNCLHSAQYVDLVRSGHCHRGNGSIWHLAVYGWSACDHS